MKGIEVMQLAITIVQLITALLIVLAVLFQSGKSSGLGTVISGSSENYMTKTKNRALDAKLAASTKWLAVVFVILTVVLNII